MLVQKDRYVKEYKNYLKLTLCYLPNSHIYTIALPYSFMSHIYIHIHKKTAAG